MILVVGATGLVGREVVAGLARAGVPVRAMVRSAERAAGLRGPGVEPVVADLADPASLNRALAGVTRAFLLSPLAPEQAILQGNLVAAARRAGPVHVVKLSGLGTAPDSPVRSGRLHARTECLIEDAGLPFTHLRPLFFMQNLLHQAPEIAATDVLAFPMRRARVAMIDARDVADVAVAILAAPGSVSGHAGRAYTLTGPEALSFDEVARTIGQARGRPVTYRDQAPEARERHLRAAGLSEWLVALRLEFAAVLAAGGADDVTGAVQAVTGRSARTLAAFAAEHAARFGAAGPSTPPAPAEEDRP
jgi:uncharacterized protein YbjT (DUF2867 family)